VDLIFPPVSKESENNEVNSHGKRTIGILNICNGAADGQLCWIKVSLGKNYNIASYFFGYC
jgi:hypothetical protein